MKVFFQKNNQGDSDFFQTIADTCEGLIYVSEIDAPVLPFASQPNDTSSEENILHDAAISGDAMIEERNFEDFFARLTAIKDWFGDREIARAKKFLELKTLLEENLRDLKVFRKGSIRIEIFAVGIDKSGRLMGVTTKAVET